VAKVRPDGTGLAYAGYVGGAADDTGYGIAVDATGAAYLTGRTMSSEATFPVVGGPDLTFNGFDDAFMAKVRPDGTGLVYAGYVGGGANDSGGSIAVDATGTVYLVGQTRSSEASFPVVGGPDLTFNGAADAFVAKLRPGLTVTKAGNGTGTVTSNPPGIICGADCGEPFPLGTQITLTAAPDPGSVFVGWGGACSGNGACQVTMEGDKGVTATFTRFTLTVARAGNGSGTVTSSPPGITCGTDCSEAFPAGTVVTLTATPDPGAGRSTFVGWGGACTGTGPCQVTMDGLKFVTATFDQATAGLQVVRRPIGQTGQIELVATLSGRSTCGPIQRIDFGPPGSVLSNAVVTITSPAGGPADQRRAFGYTPPAGTTTVTFTLRRDVPQGSATVSPIDLYDGCGLWRTLVGGGPDAFR
jgi:hypothetical protein